MKIKAERKNMKMLFAVALILSGSLLSGCGGSNGKASKTEIKINGEEPNKYYSQFIYYQRGTCGTVSESHVYPSAEVFKVDSDSEGRDVIGSLALIMNANGHFAASYREAAVRRYTESGWVEQYANEEVVEGKWKVEGEKLVLENLGTATALEYNGKPAMELKMKWNILSTGLKDQTLIMRKIFASYNPVFETDTCRN
jgi:hypothetical protein